MLVGEDVLPNESRLVLEISRVVKVGFLQQNAFNDTDTFVPLTKQFEMLKTIDLLYEEGKKALSENIPISIIRNDEIYGEVINMKYNIGNDQMDKFVELNNKVRSFYSNLMVKYEVTE